MKKICLVLILSIICLLFSSCDYSIASVDNLMRPPKLNGESRELQKAFEESVDNPEEIVMKNAISGDYRSSFLFYDIDNDNQSEAFVLFSEPSASNLACCSMFKLNNNKWVKVSTIKGRGEEIFEIDFADVNGDEVYEIVLSWTFVPDVQKTISNSLSYSGNRIFTLYSYTGNNLTLMKSDFFTELYIDDFNNDNSDELLMLNIDLTSDENRTTGRIIDFGNDYEIQRDEFFVLSNMLDIFNIVIDSHSEKTRVYIDGAVKENTYITEIVEIDNKSFDISLPLYENNISENPLTIRNANILSSDIDNDGVIEIPTLQSLPNGNRVSNNGENTALYLTVWSEFENEVLSIDFKCLYNSIFNYYFIFSDEWDNQIATTYNPDSATLKFFEISEDNSVGNEFISIRAFTTTEWENYNGEYSVFDEDGVFVYASIFDESSNIDYDEFIKNFVIID